MNTLQVGADSALLLRAGAAALLFAHIAGGSVAILSGAVGLAVRKGSRVHALAGHTFFVSMLVMASIGALVAPFLASPQGDPKYFDSMAGFFTFYLVVTGWLTVRRKAGAVGSAEIAAFLYALSLAAAAFLVGSKAAGSAAGLAGGYPSSAYYGLGSLVTLAAALDATVIVRRRLTGPSRLARHVWRMCLAMFVATGSFFLGQQRVMPEFVQGSGWLQVPPLAVLAMMVFWLLRLRLARPIAWARKKLRARRAEAATPLGATT